MKQLFTRSNIITIVILIVTSIITIGWVNANAESPVFTNNPPEKPMNIVNSTTSVNSTSNQSNNISTNSTVNLALKPIHILSPSFRTDIIGITYSKTTLALLQLNSTTIPSYQKLIELGYDHSEPVSGKFVFKNGYLQREPTKVRNELVYYENKNNITIVDPSEKIFKKIKMIIVEPTLKSYVLNEYLNKINNTRTIHHDRYVNLNCTIATVSSENLLLTLPDTIMYMLNNCTGELTNTKTVITDKTTDTDISTSQKYKDDQWKKGIKSSHLVSKIGNDPTVLKSTVEDKTPKYVPPKHEPFNYTKYR